MFMFITLIKRATIKHTDIKGLMQIDISAIMSKLKPRKCISPKAINLANIFYTKKLIVFSIIGNKVKINDIWYSQGDNISKHITIKNINPSFIIISYHNKTKKILFGEAI